MRALYTAATGMAAQELNVQVISNNIANMRTTGYKKQRAAFQDLIYDHVRRVGAQASDQGTILPVGVDIGGGVKTVGTPRMMTQGTISPTGGDLDIAVRGEGFFKIQMPDGTFTYTRDGSFTTDNTGRIVTSAGNPVQPPITIPQGAQGLQHLKSKPVHPYLCFGGRVKIIGNLPRFGFVRVFIRYRLLLPALGVKRFGQRPGKGTADARGPIRACCLDIPILVKRVYLAWYFHLT